MSGRVCVAEVKLVTKVELAEQVAWVEPAEQGTMM